MDVNSLVPGMFLSCYLPASAYGRKLWVHSIPCTSCQGARSTRSELAPPAMSCTPSPHLCNGFTGTVHAQMYPKVHRYAGYVARLPCNRTSCLSPHAQGGGAHCAVPCAHLTG